MDSLSFDQVIETLREVLNLFKNAKPKILARILGQLILYDRY